MDKVDFTKSLDCYRAPHGGFRLVEVLDLQYLMLDGCGDPNRSQTYSDTLATLYPVAYTLKFLSKVDLGRDYVVPPLEGLWWAEDMDSFTVSRDKSRWQWTMMLMVPDWLDASHVRDAVGRAGAKNPPPRLDGVRFEPLSEGLCVQTLHVGPYDDEGPVLQRMHDEFIPGHGLRVTGRHHEIYLGDARRTAPGRLRTILRQPVTAS